MTNMAFTSFAYKAAIVPLLLAEVNYVADKLGLEERRPVTTAALRQTFIRPPFFGFGGVLSTTNFTYTFYKSGKLMSIGRIDSEGMIIPSINEFDALAKVKSQIDSKQAYQLATQWLGSISFDIQGYEKVSTLRVEQLTSKQVGLLPLFEIHWNATNSAGQIEVHIDGSTKQLSYLFIQQPQAGAYLHRPAMVITNAAELNAIPDPPKKSLSP